MLIYRVKKTRHALRTTNNREKLCCLTQVIPGAGWRDSELGRQQSGGEAAKPSLDVGVESGEAAMITVWQSHP